MIFSVSLKATIIYFEWNQGRQVQTPKTQLSQLSQLRKESYFFSKNKIHKRSLYLKIKLLLLNLVNMCTQIQLYCSGQKRRGFTLVFISFVNFSLFHIKKSNKCQPAYIHNKSIDRIVAISTSLIGPIRHWWVPYLINIDNRFV